VRIPPLPPAEAGTRFSDPGGMQGWVDLCKVCQCSKLAICCWIVLHCLHFITGVHTLALH